MRFWSLSRRSSAILLLALIVGAAAPAVRAAGLSSPSLPLAAAEKTAAEHAGEAGGHDEGIPAWHTDLALWALVVFLIFVYVLKRYAWGPLIAGLNKREQQVRQDLADAENARKKAEQMLAEHQQKLDAVQDEVREILAEARRDADHTKQEIVETARREAEATKDRAVGEINRARDAALKELFDTMSSQVAEATEYVIGRSLTGDDQTRLIDEALGQISP